MFPDIYSFGLAIEKPSNSGIMIFGFEEFISALALLVIIYTITDTRYRFRVEIAPIPVFKITFYSIAAIGFSVLLTDIWASASWSFLTIVPQPVWRGFLGGWFLSIVMIWIYYGFIKPPIYSSRNYKQFASALYRIILKGSDSDLQIVADEISRSAHALITHSYEHDRFAQEGAGRPPEVNGYAHDMLLLIGNRKFCRHLIIASPSTAINIFNEIAIQKKFNVPIGQFSRNISAEAIEYRDSILYHEDDGYSSGLIGHIKPFSKAIYGNYELVESLSGIHASPLDVDYKKRWTWDSTQYELYCNLAKVTLGAYLENERRVGRSISLNQAIEHIKDGLRNTYRLNDMSDDIYETDYYKMLSTAVRFCESSIDMIAERTDYKSIKIRTKAKKRLADSLVDKYAELMYDIVYYAACIRNKPSTCWHIHYSTVWSHFTHKDHKLWRILQHKLRRLIYDEIKHLGEFPNYKSSKYLAFCLNVYGVKLIDKKQNKDFFPLQKSVIRWVVKNYMNLREDNVNIANDCLVGSISYDENANRLVKTYLKGLRVEDKFDYLDLIT